MSNQIIFRSKTASKHTIGNSNKHIRQRGSDWSHLRQYNPLDDIRDIAWSKIRPEWISVRERQNSWDFDIISYWGETEYDNFHIWDEAISKWNISKEFNKILKKNAQFWWHQYRDFFGETGLKNLIKQQPKNKLIFIWNYENIDENIKLLAFHNDLIFIDLRHPFEIDPTDDYLFSGKIIDVISYKKFFEAYRENTRKNIHKISASYLLVKSNQDITETLNHFFKRRYSIYE